MKQDIQRIEYSVDELRGDIKEGVDDLEYKIDEMKNKHSIKNQITGLLEDNQKRLEAKLAKTDETIDEIGKALLSLSISFSISEFLRSLEKQKLCTLVISTVDNIPFAIAETKDKIHLRFYITKTVSNREQSVMRGI